VRGKSGPRDLNKKSLPQLKTTLDILFAKWIKLNWCHPEATTLHCYTCEREMRLGEVSTQAGHFISRTYSPVRYDENNVRPQCAYCNDKRSGNGKPIEFERNLRLEVGDYTVDELKARALIPWKWSREDLIDKIIYYRQQIKDLGH